MNPNSNTPGSGDYEYSRAMKRLISGAIPTMISRAIRKMEESGELDQYATRALIQDASRIHGSDASNGSSDQTASITCDELDGLERHKTFDRLPIGQACLEDLRGMCSDVVDGFRPVAGYRIEGSTLEFLRHKMEVELVRIFQVADRYRIHGGREQIMPLHVRLALEQLEYHQIADDEE